jgi:hypothetical protein
VLTATQVNQMKYSGINVLNKSTFKNSYFSEMEQESILNLFFDDKETYLKFLNLLGKYIKYNFPISVLIAQWPIYLILEKNLSPRDSSSERAYIAKYGEELGKEFHKDKTSRTIITRDDFVEKYGEEKAAKILSGRSGKIEAYIARHGEEEGKRRWKEYCDKRNKTFKSKRGTYTKRNLAWFIERHGEEKGYKIWDDKRKAQAYKVSYAYYVEIYGDQAQEKIRECKSRDLNFFIKKYGEEEGLRRHDEKRLKASQDLIKRGYSTPSKWSLAVCEKIKEFIPDLKYYGYDELIWELSLEFKKLMKQKIVRPDLFYKGKVIEFQGDAFHANPDLYEDSECPHPFDKNITAKEMRNADAIRMSYYKSKEYEYLEIWQKDWYNNPKETLEKCLIFLNSTMKSSV